MAILDQLLNDLKSKPKPADNSPPVADAPNSSANAEAVRGLDTTFNPWETNKQASTTSTKTSETDATPQLPQVVPQAATPQAPPVTPQVFQTRTRPAEVFLIRGMLHRPKIARLERLKFQLRSCYWWEAGFFITP